MGMQRMVLYMWFLTSLLGYVHCQGAAVLTLHHQVVYNGEWAIFTCSYGAGNRLSIITLDAFNGSQKKGSFSCNVLLRETSISGVFNDTALFSDQCGEIIETGNFSLFMTATPSLELDFICITRVVTDQGISTTLTSEKTSLKVEGASVLTLSDQSVYSGETVIFTCSYGAGNWLSTITIDAYDGSQKKGSFYCGMALNEIRISGVFNDTELGYHCGRRIDEGNFTLSVQATPSLELDFICTTRIVTTQSISTTLTSIRTSLTVEDVLIKPNPPVFNEGDSAFVLCESRHSSTRTEFLQLIVLSQNGNDITTSGIGSTSVRLPLPLINWHNAFVYCLEGNDNSTKKKISKFAVVFINPLSIDEHLSTQTPDATSSSRRNSWILFPFLAGALLSLDLS